MSARAIHLVIDARPRGPRGPARGRGGARQEHARSPAGTGRSSLRRRRAGDRARARGRARAIARAGWRARSRAACSLSTGRPGRCRGPADRSLLRRRAAQAWLLRGRSPESAVLWRLDRAETLATRRRRTDAARRRISRWESTGRSRWRSAWRNGSGRRHPAQCADARERGPDAFGGGDDRRRLPAWIGRAAIALSLATALVLDTADGRLARLQGTSSAFGRWLDQVLDELADMALHAAIAWAAFCRDGRPGWLLLGMLYASSKYLFQVQSLLGEELERSGGPGDRTQRRRQPTSAANRSRRLWHLRAGLPVVACA